MARSPRRLPLRRVASPRSHRRHLGEDVKVPSKKKDFEGLGADAAAQPDSAATPLGNASVSDSDGAGAAKAKRGSSPYSTGGGGVTFAQLVASVYLTTMLTGGRKREASDLPVRTVGFQNGPEHPIDDLLITCGDGTAEVTLAVACRATPD